MANLQTLPAETVARLTPIAQLCPQARSDLITQATNKHLPAGAQLFGIGETDDWTIYLLDGEVDLAFRKGLRQTMAGTSANANLPLLPQRPRLATATARTDVNICQFSSQAIDGALKTGGAASSPDAEHRLLYALYDDYSEDRLTVPILPSIALRIRDALDNPSNTVSAINDIVSNESTVAERLIAVANSVAYRSVMPAKTCRDAISRLGVETTRDVVTAIVLRQLFHAEDKTIRPHMYALWRHSVEVATFAHVLATYVSGLEPEQAMLAGLVHDLGTLPVLARAGSEPELWHNEAELELVVKKLRGPIGATVLRKWDFPSYLINAALEAEDWYRDPAPKPDYTDVVMVAQMLADKTMQHASDVPALDGLAAFTKLDLGELLPHHSLQIIDDSKDKIVALRSTFAGG